MMKKYTLIATCLSMFLGSLTQSFASHPYDDIDGKFLLSAIYKTWGEDSGVDESTVNGVLSSIDESTGLDDAVKVIVNGFVGQGLQTGEIGSILGEHGFIIPCSGYLDYGLHENLFGKTSFSGSFTANLKGAWNSGLVSWFIRNVPLILGYVATFNTISGLVPVAAATPVTSGVCNEPLGNFQQTCSQVKVTPFTSDGSALPSCMVKAKCNTIYESMPPVDAQLAYRQGSTVTLGNENGTLVVLNEKLQPVHYKCKALPGSYQKSCQIIVKSGGGVVGACNMTAKCKDLSYVRKNNTVYYYAHEQTSATFENCNGKLVFHPKSQSDGICGKDVTVKAIKDLSAARGRSIQRLAKEDL